MEDNDSTKGNGYVEKTQQNLTAYNPSKVYCSGLNLDFVTLSKIAIFKFGGVSGFAKALHVSRSRAKQILTGYSKEIPKKPSSIKKIADLLNLDIVLLTRLFYEGNRYYNETDFPPKHISKNSLFKDSLGGENKSGDKSDIS